MRNEAKRKRESVEGERSKRGFVREEKKRKTSVFIWALLSLAC